MADHYVPSLVIIVRKWAEPDCYSRRGWIAELDLDGAESPMGYGLNSGWEAVSNLMLGLAVTGVIDRCFSREPPA